MNHAGACDAAGTAFVRAMPPLRLILILLLSAVALLPVRAFAATSAAPQPALPAASEWHSLFDGATLTGWKAAEHPASFRVEGGAIVCDGPRAHLFYTGPAAPFENFEFEAEVFSHPGANSGIFFHTAWQEESWPAAGFEVQVNNSQPPHRGYYEMKKTGSLYGVSNIYRAPAKDEAWFTLKITVERPRVQVRVNAVLVVEYIEPHAPLPEGAPALNRLGQGTFALQCHDPKSQVRYRNLRVRPLPPGEHTSSVRPVLDTAGAHRLQLARDNFPLLDLHTHLKGDLTLDKALALSRSTGVGLGIATNGGIGFPIQTDSAARAFLDTMQGQPVFLALQAEGREWTELFSPETRAAFDYIFTDAMTYTNPEGKRLRLWIPAEAEVGPDPEAFMDHLVEQIVAIVSTEPIDVYVNPTFLPDTLAGRADVLWTEARMKRVIAALARHGVAVEINARYRIPSLAFLRLAKAEGLKFTFGTNNTSAADFGDWSYPLQIQRALDLSWKDMFVPGQAPSRAQRALAGKR